YPSPLKIGDVTDLTPSEIAVHRTDTGVEILRRGRLWRISSYPEYARGEIPPWRGLEMALDDGRRRFENGKITMRITELERILSIGLTECDNEGCLCRSKYPGETAYQMKVGDVVSLHLHTDGSGLYFRALELVVNGQLYPATLEAKRCGRLILKGSGAWSVALLLGVDHITTPKHSDNIVEEACVLGAWNITLQPDTPVYWLKCPDLKQYLVKFRVLARHEFAKRLKSAGVRGLAVWVESTGSSGRVYRLGGRDLTCKPLKTSVCLSESGVLDEQWEILIQGNKGVAFLDDRKAIAGGRFENEGRKG
ncbi:hypothetical protein FOL46_001130, partial [Perkinsus olseni]